MASSLTPEEIAQYPETKQPAIIASSVVFLVLCNASVFVRIISQWRLSKRLFLDDYAIIFAAICSDITGALYLNATSNGLGLHIYRVLAEDPRPPQCTISLFKALYLNAVFTGPCFLAIKVSLLWFYRRTFLVHQKWLRVAWWVNLVYVILWAIASTLFYIFQCIPPDYYWKRMYGLFRIPPPSPISGQCNSATPVLVALPLIFSLVSDFGILLLPAISVVRLQMRTMRKLGLIVVFSLGLLACICEIVRIWLEITVSAFADPTYANVTFVIFTFAEGNIAITAACMPLIASQWLYYSQRLRSSRVSGSGGSEVPLKRRRGAASIEGRSASYSHEDAPQSSQWSVEQAHGESPTTLKTQIVVKRDIDVESGTAESTEQ